MQPTKAFQDPIVVHSQAPGKLFSNIGHEIASPLGTGQPQAPKIESENAQTSKPAQLTMSDVQPLQATHTNSLHTSIAASKEEAAKSNQEKPTIGFWGHWLCVPRCGRFWSTQEDERLLAYWLCTSWNFLISDRM
jgi:hypothetical protein